jgi:hypothetical protein
MDHGGEGGLGDAGEERLSISDFRGYADLAVMAGKHLLVIMDACHSTRFAREVWADLSAARGAASLDTVAQHVCFLTSAEGSCYNSLTVVSRDPSLVYLFDSMAYRSTVQLALGYRKHNSMFGRQLNWILAYGWPVGRAVRTTFGELINAMNGPVDGLYGFCAELVTRGTDWARSALEWFFPIGKFAPTDPVRGWQGTATVEEVIPSPAMGILEDDICAYFTTPALDREVGEICVVIGPGAGPGRATFLGYGVMCKDNSDTGRIYEAAHCDRDPAAEKTGVADQPSVSMSAVCWRFEEIVKNNGWVRARTDVPDEARHGVRRIVEKKLTRPLDTPDWHYLGLLMEYASIRDQRDAVFEVLENQWDSLTVPIGSA